MASETQPSGVRLQDTKPQEDGAALRMYENSTKLEYLRNVDLPENGFSVATRRSSGSFYLSVGLSAGDWVVEWWDGVRELRSGTTIASRAISGAYANASPKVIKVFPVSSSEYFTSLTVSSMSLCGLDLSRLSQLNSLTCSGSSISGTLDLSHMTSLQYLTFSSSDVEKIILSEDPSTITGLDIQSNQNLTEVVNLEKCVNVDSLYIGNSGFARLDMREWNGVTQLSADSSSVSEVLGLGGVVTSYGYYSFFDCANLTSIDVAGASGDFVMSFSSSGLNEIRGVGASNSTYYSSSYLGFNLSYCQLEFDALDQFYTDLAAGGGGINVDGNPGATGDDPTIATAKGYTVFG